MLIASRSVMLSKSQQIPICSQTHSICSRVYLGRMLAREGSDFLEQNSWILTLNTAGSKQTTCMDFLPVRFIRTIPILQAQGNGSEGG